MAGHEAQMPVSGSIQVLSISVGVHVVQARQSLSHVAKVISQYSEAYAQLEELQRSSLGYLPIGDQKTGVIGEFYAKLFAELTFPGSTCTFGNPSEHGWDIKVSTGGGGVVRIQVKSVSEYSGLSRVSPIHKGWDQLWLLRLDKELKPMGFWTIQSQDVPWSRLTLKDKTMPRRESPGTGSKEFRAAADRTEEFVKTVNERIRELRKVSPRMSSKATRT
jgi:hypothetical protein